MCEFCSDITFVFSQKQAIQLAKEIPIADAVENAINALFEKKGIDKKTLKTLWQSHNKPLQKAVEEGYGKTLLKVEYGTPNYEFLKQLKTNTAVFAMFKMHSSIKEMGDLLTDEHGNLRSKEEFKKLALQIDTKYRSHNLDVEYDTAVRQARMASKWKKIEQNKHLYPNLKYLHTKAAHPDPVHLKYVGIIRPVDDPFWDTHYPPSRWRCQCDVEQVDDEPTDIPANLPPVPADFAFNSGKTGQVFDIKNSDYIKRADPKEIPGLIKQAETFFNADLAESAPLQPLYKSKAGTVIEAHPLAMHNSDFQQNFDIARDLANSPLKDRKIEILPLVNDKELRKKLIPDAKGGTTADFRIDGKLIEAKLPELEKASSSTLQNRIAKAHKQADGLMIRFSKSWINENHLFEDIYAKLHHKGYKGFVIYLKYGDDWKYYTRESFARDYMLRKKP